MSDPRSETNSPSGNNPNPRIATMGDLWRVFLAVRGPQLRHGWNYATANAGRRYATAGFGLILLVAIAAVSMTGGKDVVPQPPKVVAAGSDVHEAKLGDSWINIAKANGIADWHDMVDANPGLVQENTDWCNARPTGENYRAGLRIDGQPRDDDFCVLFLYGGKMQAITTLRVGQRYHLPPVSAIAVANNVN